MAKFYFYLWLQWALRLSVTTLLLATLFSSFITLYLYVKEGSKLLDAAVVEALWKIFHFWFMVSFTLALLLALFGSIKYIFNRCYNGYRVELLSCSKSTTQSVVEVIGYGNLIKVWRKWLMLLIWLVGAQMVLLLAINILFMQGMSFAWFSIYTLCGAILVAGYFSFIILSAKCKQVRIRKC